MQSSTTRRRRCGNKGIRVKHSNKAGRNDLENRIDRMSVTHLETCIVCVKETQS